MTDRLRNGIRTALPLTLMLLFAPGCEEGYNLKNVPAKSQAVLAQSPPAKDPSPAPTSPPVPPAPGIEGIAGFVTDATNGLIIPNALVILTDLSDFKVVASATTDAAGHYQILQLPPRSYSLDFANAGYIDYTPSTPAQVLSGHLTIVNASLSPILASGEIRIVLNWTPNKTGAVRDVDSYLQIPGESTQLPIFWSHKTGPGATLDHDMTQWVGPETVTISQQLAGTYVYYVNNYNLAGCDSYALGNSDVRVTVYQGSKVLKQYAVPPGFGITYEVFHLTNGVIQDVQQYNDSLPAAGQTQCLP